MLGTLLFGKAWNRQTEAGVFDLDTCVRPRQMSLRHAIWERERSLENVLRKMHH